jgi:hypothetical protein
MDLSLIGRHTTFGAALAALLVTASCGGGGDQSVAVYAGAASRSILPTVEGSYDYLTGAPGWPAAAELDPDNPGLFVPAWDQGRVDVGNGSDDGSWVHDDLTTTAVAFERGDDRVVLVTTDTYMHFSPDADEIERRCQAALPAPWSTTPIVVSSTHNHHGPDTAFSINDEWYAQLASQVTEAVVEAVSTLQEAKVSVAAGQHGYGVTDARDPIIMDRRLNVMTIDAADSGDAIATIVQWNSHPETTLGWDPPADAAGLPEACAAKGWDADDCSAKGRYFTADYPGALRARLGAIRGGEVFYVNGPLGSQIGPGGAPTWVVDEDHPVTADGTAPPGAVPLTTCDDREPLYCRSFAKTASIGTELANAVDALIASATPLDMTELTLRSESFYTRMTNIGFRVLLSDGSLGWTEPVLYTCDGHPAADNCVLAPNESEDDPVLTPFFESQITVGDVLQTRIQHLDMGDVGFLFMPGELPPEMVVGLPDDFVSSPDQYYDEPELHAFGAEYEIPGHLLSLVDETMTFTVGLGSDELGYWVPLSDIRLPCPADFLPVIVPGSKSCAELAEAGAIESPEYVGGETCSAIAEDADALAALGEDGPTVQAICRYGQALGRELGEADGHYEETNSIGWDVVVDMWAAAERLFESP